MIGAGDDKGLMWLPARTGAVMLAVYLAVGVGHLEVFGKTSVNEIDSSLETTRPLIEFEPERPRTHPERHSDNQRGNPLWRIPLTDLEATRKRPIFSASRRPPAPPAVAAPYVQPPPPAPAEKPVPDHPMITVLGTITGDAEEIGIFFDSAQGKVIRLKRGQSFEGWELLAVHGRNAEFRMGNRSATMNLPSRSETTVAQPVVRSAASSDATWTDGDGQLIAPPRGASLAGRQPYNAEPWMGPQEATARRK